MDFRYFLDLAAVKIQKVWKGFLVRERMKIARRKKGRLIMKKIKLIDGKFCHVSVSETKNEFFVRVYQVLHYFEFTLILPKYSRFNAGYLIKQLDYHPLKLYFIREELKKSSIWEIVMSTLKKIDGIVYVFRFYRKIDSNKLKINFFEIGETIEHSTILYSDIEIIEKSTKHLKRVIEKRILKRLVVNGNTLEIKNPGESQTFESEFEKSLIKIKRFIRLIRLSSRVTSNLTKSSFKTISFNPLPRSSYETFSVNSENNFDQTVPSTIVQQKVPEKKLKKILISKPLTKYIDPQILAAIKIQKFYKMLLAREKFKLMRLQAFRKVSIRLIGRGGKVIGHVPFYIVVFKCRFNFYIKVKNLLTGQIYFTEITPRDYIFGYIKTHSCRRIFRSLNVLEEFPVFEYKRKLGNSVDLRITEYVKFKKISETISLHQATSRIQSIFKTIQIRNDFRACKERQMFHSKLSLEGQEYHASVHQKKTELFFEIYLLKKPSSGIWLYSFSLENKSLIQKYGEINPSVILKDLRMTNGQISIGMKKSKQDFLQQKHESFIFNEVLTEEKHLSRSLFNSHTVDTYLRTFKNKFLDTVYTVISLECYLPEQYSSIRQISIHLTNASESLGIPLLWIHPIAYFLRVRCLKLSTSSISLNLKNKKVNLDLMAGKIQKTFKKFLKTRGKRGKSNKKKTLRYRISLLIKK
jgi:hypothetical protein